MNFNEKEYNFYE